MVTTTVGKLEGSTVSVDGVKLSQWLGVPYAESTAGERRFKKPVPLNVSDRSVVVDAVKPRPPCAQWVPGRGVVGNEDCLRLNIWAPADMASGAAMRSLVLAATGDWFQRGTNHVPQWEELAAKAYVFVHEWAHYRYGVFDEYGSQDDDKYPLTYCHDGKVKLNSCSERIRYRATAPNGEKCMITQKCQFLKKCMVHIYQADVDPAEASIMFMPYQSNVSV
ncbi:hypothetical protein V5799_016143 [Amblyomma americanum]|uniref:Carboxylesterase type B domain-containing protein n=1 Tax=Amblyomma americanum TaxID=6943 RepID=A0AAQ4F720_AMBAM